MGTKFCSTGVLDGLLYAVCTDNPRIIVTTSSDVLPTLASCSSNSSSCLVQSTNAQFPDAAYYTISSSGNNRVLVISACSCDTVLNTGVASYVVLWVGTSSIRYITTCTTQDLTAGNKANIGTWAITVNQPS